MAGKNFFSGGGSKKCENFFRIFRYYLMSTLQRKQKKRGCAYLFGDMGLAKTRSKRVGNFVLPFSPFFFLGTGVHPHPPPTTYWCQTNLK